jgi:hyperosmotically inducible periplasmic protein
MKKQLFIASTLCLLLTACDTNRGGAPAADNTGRNTRDRNQTLTSGDQSENEADRTITQKARQAIMDDDSLSTNAKNIKIITQNGVVTLRGPVNSDREKNEIARKIRAVSGVKNVDNQLEVNQSGNANNQAGGNQSRGGEAGNRGDNANR